MNQLEQQIKRSLDESANAIDDETRAELANRRRLAMHQPRSWFNMRYFVTNLVPAGSLAFCLMMTIFYVQNPYFSTGQQAENIAQTDTQKPDEQLAALELLTNTEDLEVMSDPYFLVWLSEEADAQAAQQVKKHAV